MTEYLMLRNNHWNDDVPTCLGVPEVQIPKQTLEIEINRTTYQLNCQYKDF